MDREKTINQCSANNSHSIFDHQQQWTFSGCLCFYSDHITLKSGTSDDNTQFNCKIQVLVNGKHPYQNAIPAAGPGDYSKWSFTITPQYTEIEPGLNKITSKATCDAPYEPFLVQDPITKQFVKFYSINVTGTSSSLGDSVPFPGSPSASPEEQNGGDEANGANDGGEGNEGNPPDGELFE